MKKNLIQLSILCFALSATSVNAAVKYWDLNGATAGAGGAAPSGTWDTATTANWTTDLLGASAPTTWTANDSAVFSAGTDASGSFTITIPNATTVAASAVTVEEGTVLLGPGTLNFGTVNGIFDVASGATMNISGTGSGFVTGTGGITKNNAGVLFLGGTEGYTNSTSGAAILTINAGVVDFSGETGLGLVPATARAAAVTINGGTLRYSGITALTLNVLRGVTIGASGGTIEVVSTAGTGLSLPSAATFTLNGAGLMTKTGAGRFTENTTSGSFTGKYKILAGDISAPGDGRFGAVPASAVADYFILDGATAGIRNSLTTTITIDSKRGITLGAGGGTFIQPTAGPLVYNGIIAGTSGGALRVANNDGNGAFTGGIVTLGGANTYDGPTTIAASTTLKLGAADVIPDTSVVTPLGSAGFFDLGGFNETVKSISGTAGTIAVGANTLTLNNPAGESYSSVFTATAGGKVIKNGSGTLTLSGNSTGFGGEFVVNNGTIGFGGSGALGASATAGIVTINGGKLSNTAAGGRTVVATVALNLSGDFTVDDSLFGPNPGQILFNGPATIRNSNRTITVAGAGNLGLGGGVGQDVAGRSLTKAGSGILALTGISTYSGDTTINAGQININGTGTLGDATGTLHLSGGTLNSTATRSASSAPVANPVDVTADSFITTSSAAATVDLNLSSSTIGGTAGSLTFSNAAASGTGVFQPRFSGSGFNFSQPLGIANGGTAGTTALNSYNTTGTDQTFSGVISGNGSYVRNASSAGTGGRTMFTAANTYSGGTTVSRGTLLVNNTTGSGTGSGSVTVGSDGTLGGTGTISGSTTVAAGGILAPGASIGTLTFGGSLALAGTLSMEISKTGASADKIVMSSGTVTLGGTLTVVNLAGTLAANDVFDLIDGAIAGSFGTFNLPVLAAGLAWDTTQLAPGGNGTIKVICSGSLSASAGSDKTICTGASAALGGSPTATGGSGYTYLWSPATGLDDATLANPTATPTSTTAYTVTVSDSAGCTAQASATVTVDAPPTITTQPASQAVCSGSTASFSVTASGLGLSYSWAKHNNGGWGAAWSTTGSGSTFRGSSTDDNFGDPACTSLSAANDINSPSGNALGMWGGASGDETATRTFGPLSAGQVVSIDFDHGNVDSGSKVGFSLQTSGGGDVLQFYFLGGASNYKYNDGTEQDTGIGFQRTGLRVQFVLTSPTTYTLIVTPCGGASTNFTGTYSGTIAQLKLFNQNNTGGSDKNIYFNNFIVGGYTDNADNYSGDFAGQDKGDQPIASGNGGSSYTTPALTVGDNGTQYEVVVSGCGGSVLSSAAAVTVNPPAMVDAGSDQAVCASSPVVALAGAIGGGASSATWSGGAGVFTPDNTTTNATYAPTAGEIAAGTVTLTLTTDDPAGPCGSANDTMTITIGPVATANAGPDQAVCASSPVVTLAGAIGGSASSAAWSGGAGVFTPDNATLNASYTPTAGEIAAGTVTLTLTTDDPAGACSAASDSMTIAINPAATANAGPDQAVCASSPATILAGAIGGGASSAAWSGGAGIFTPDNTTLNTTYHPTAGEVTAGAVTLTLTTDDPAGPCGSVSDTVTITINPVATVNAGPDQAVCASSSAVTLAGTFGGVASSVTWSGGAGIFTPDNTTTNATYTPTAGEISAGTVTLTLTTDDPAGPCGPVSDSMTITINPAATVNAGPAQAVCASSPAVTLAGTFGGAAASVSWSGGAGVFTPDNTTTNATYTPTTGEISAGTVTLTLTTDDPAGPCGPVSDSMTITINPAATVNAGPDQAVCASSPAVTLAGTFGGSAASVTWSGGAGSFTPDNTTTNATYTPTAGEVTAGTVTLTLTTDDPAGPCGPVSDSMTITINPVATVDAGPDQAVCASSPTVTLAGTFGGSAASVTWSGGAGVFTPDNTTTNATYTPTVGEISTGTVTLTLTTDDPAGPCGPVSDSITITINPVATVNAGPDQVICASSPAVTLTATFGGSAASVTWSGGAGVFTPDNTTTNATYTPTAGEVTAGTVTLTLTTDDPAGPCGPVSDSMTITINPAATANAGPDQAVCASSPAVTLAGTFGGSAASVTWSGGAGVFTPDNTTTNATYTPTAGEVTAGTLTLTLTTDDPAGPCGPVSDSMTITFDKVTANTVTIPRTVGASLQILISNLLTNASDTDLETITLVGVGTDGSNLLSTNGATLSTNGTSIFYTNSVTPGVDDRFDYQVTDVRGCTAIGTVLVHVVPQAQATAITFNAGVATVTFAGSAGITYQVQRSTNLVDWVTLVTTNAPSGGVFEWADNFSDLGVPPNPVPTSSFYRLREP